MKTPARSPRALAYLAGTTRYLPLWIPRPWITRATEGRRP